MWGGFILSPARFSCIQDNTSPAIRNAITGQINDETNKHKAKR